MTRCMIPEEPAAILSTIALMLGISEAEISQEDIVTFSRQTDWPLIEMSCHPTSNDFAAMQLEQIHVMQI